MTHTPITLQPADDRKGTVVVRHYPDVRIHTYISPPDGFLVNTHMIEGPEKLVLFDGQLLNTYAAEVAAYASRLGKPVEQIIVSHAHPDHWAWLEVLAARFPTASIAALPAVTDQIRMGGETMLAALRRAYGGRVAALPTLPAATITLGRQTIAGVPFEFRELQDIESDVQLLALMPEQQILLAFDLVFAPRDHAFTVAPHFDHWISVLETLQGMEGYETILIGHDLLTDRAGSLASRLGGLLRSGALQQASPPAAVRGARPEKRHPDVTERKTNR